MSPSINPIRGWPHHIEYILELIRAHQPQRAVEIGTYCGASAIPILQLLQAWGGTLTCVDPWKLEPGTLRECVDNLQAAGLAHRVRLIPAESVWAATRWTEGLIDFLYIDGDHAYDAVLADLWTWWPLLRPGAVVCGDDYDDPVSPGVARAWDEFGQTVGQSWHLFETPNTNPPGMKLIWGIKR